MKSWLVITILLLTLVVVVGALPAQAKPETDAWSKYPIPQKGKAGGWVLTSDVTSEATGVTAICVAFDGTIYAATEEIAGSPLNGYNLFKSTDGGYTWTPLWRIPAGDGGSRIIALTLPQCEDSSILYLATQYNIYKSIDGGEHFTSLASPNPSSGALITSPYVTDHDGTHLIVVSTRDADGGDYGGVYFYNESQPFNPWADLQVGGDAAGTKYDVLAIAFSPNFADDEQIVAVVTDETDTIATTKIGGAEWGATVGDAYLLDPTFTPWAATGASLAFPADYDSDVSEDKYTQYIGINIGGLTGGIYVLMGLEAPANSMAIPVFAPAPVYSLAAAGNAFGITIIAGEVLGVTLVAGLTNGSVINIATGVAYTPPSAPPAENAYVALGGLYGSDYIVYAGTSGVNGGFARSVDSGATFARTVFICDDIMTITDLAVSPIYDKDDTMYMITEGHSGKQILWRTTDRGTTWDAVLTEGQQITNINGSTKTVGDFDKVALSPKFTSDTTVFICESGNEPNIWRSTDNGFRFWALPSTPTTATIDSWIVVGIKKVLVGDSLGNFYKTANGGLTWSEEVATGLSGFSSMVLSPAYDDDHAILAGGDDGRVFRSTNDGSTWKEITKGGFGGKDGEDVYVAVHPDYADNGIFFAAGDDGDSNLAIDRYDNGWETIFEGSTADTGNTTGLVVSPDGTLYCTFSDSDGMFRSLNPLEEEVDKVEFEPVVKEISVALKALYLTAGSHVLLGFEDGDTYYYEDTLAVPVVLSAPDDGASSGRVDSAELKWDKLGSANMYRIEVDTDPGFDSADSDDTSLTSVRVTGLEDGRTYYWRVRVAEGEPVLSRWSEVWSFTTSLSAAEWNPFVGGVPEAPSNGATSVPIRPAFAWNPADWATRYELVVARDSKFADLVTSKMGDNALTIPTWACDRDLDYNATYYWKVRAISPTSYSQWALGIFTTESAPPAPVSSPSPSPPAPLPAPATPVSIWVMLAIVVALVITLLVLIVTTRHPY